MLQKTLHYTFLTPDLVLLLFVQPSIKNIFNEMGDHSWTPSSSVGTQKEFAAFREMATELIDSKGTLALIGDKAIDLALFQHSLAEKKGRIPNKGTLDKKRQNYASNLNFDSIYDTWKLNEYRIPQDSYVRNVYGLSEETTATVVEAIFGVIFLEQGIERVEEVLSFVIIDN